MARMSDSSALWSELYRPRIRGEIVGNAPQISAIMAHIKDVQCGKQQRPILISGPPGVGKTTCAHVCLTELGAVALEINSSDVRDSREVSNIIRNVCTRRPLCSTETKGLIFDEIDGSTQGRYGGITELVKLCKSGITNRVPIICICNESSGSKLKSLVDICLHIQFNTVKQCELLQHIRQLVKKTQCSISKENAKLIIEECNGDVRQMVNSLQMLHQHSKHNANKRDVFASSDLFMQTRAFFEATSYEQRECIFQTNSDMLSAMIHENGLQDISTLEGSCIHLDCLAIADVLKWKVPEHETLTILALPVQSQGASPNITNMHLAFPRCIRDSSKRKCHLLS